ncbi:hypothetical protein ACFY1U_10605 [Streptomyces sp. NPDC001351]|uniref:hypothetical protein n=1 Tax=Streptomyces sp. NPDC001351 TaxID=3364564 RepID=UPI0036BEC492
MRAADEAGTGRRITEPVAACNGSAPKTHPIMPHTSSNEVSRPLSHQPYPDECIRDTGRAMRPADEDAMRRLTTQRSAACTGSAPKTDPPHTSSDTISQPPTHQPHLDERLRSGACAMRAADEDARGRLVTEPVAAWNRSTPKTGSIMPHTSSDEVSRPLSHQRCLDGIDAGERAR